MTLQWNPGTVRRGSATVWTIGLAAMSLALSPSAIGLAEALDGVSDAPGRLPDDPGPLVVQAGLTGTAVDLNYKCGSSSASSLLGAPALVGSCLFQSVVAPLSTTRLLVEIVMTPTSSSSSGSPREIGVGYRGYSVGYSLDAVVGSPVQMSLDVSGLNLLSGGSLCDASAKLAVKTLSGGSATRALLFSKGSTVLTRSGDAFVQLSRSSASTSSMSITGTLTGGCSGNKVIRVDLTGSFATISGSFKSISFSASGVPSSLTVRVDDTSSTSKRIEVFHNSNTFSGEVSVSGIGTATFTNAPKHYKVLITKDAAGDLDTVTATADTAPTGGSTLQFSGTVKGITIFVRLEKLTAMTLTADLPDKRLDVDLGFDGRNGFIDMDVAGTWKSVAYNARLDGSGLGSTDLIIQAAAPNLRMGSFLRGCASGCGTLTAVVDLTFFGIGDISPTSGIHRQSDGRYHLQFPVSFDETVFENECRTKLFSRVTLCAKPID